MISQRDPSVDSRSGRDRRRRQLPGLRALLRHPRRGRVRRSADRGRIVLLDRYRKSMLLPMLMVLVLSVTDAWWTLYLLAHGAVELNPIMAFLLEKGPTVFVLVKYILTAVSVMIVLVLNDIPLPFSNLFMRDLLKLFAGLFALVIVWQLFLTVRYVL